MTSPLDETAKPDARAVQPSIPPGRSAMLRTLPSDRYADFRPVGAGGMGIVYWALDTEMNRAVAFKIVRPPSEAGDDETPPAPGAVTPPPRGTDGAQTFAELKTRFLQEAWVTGGMEHPGVVPVYEMGQTPAGVPYYTMRFVKGGRSLAKAIAERHAAGLDGRLPLLEPFLKVCDAIRYAHARGVIHRDLKPENVALGEFGETVVLDWGLAKIKEAPDLSASRWQARVREYRDATSLKTMDSAMGTPGYMSPEAALGDVDAVDERSDVYSLGAILYEVLTGRLPFEFRSYLEFARQVTTKDAPAAKDLEPAVPQALSDLCARALARERSRRTASVDELAAGVRAWQAQNAVDREVASLLNEARSAVEAASGLSGYALLQRLEGPRVCLAQVARLKPGLPETEDLLARVRELGERGVLERERQARRRLLRQLAFVALVVVALAGAGVSMLLDARRREAEESAERARIAERHASLEAERANQERDRANQEKERADREAADARRRLHEARVLALVNASAEASHTDPMLALLLAREAVVREATPASLSRLHAALTESREDAVYSAPAALRSALYSPDGQLVLLVAEDGSAHVRRAWGDEAVTALEGHTEEITDAAWSREGDRIATASKDGTVRLWDVQGRALAVIGEHAGGASAVALSPAGDRVVTGAEDGLARVFDARGTLLATLRGHEERVNAIRVSPDGSRIVTASADGTARLFGRDGRQVAVLRGHEGDLLDAAFSPSGDLVATASEDATARLWDAAGSEVAALEGHDGAVKAVAFSPDGETLVTGSTDRTARLWRTDGTAISTLAGHESDVLCVGFSSGGGLVATGSADYTARIWNAQGHPLVVLRGHLLDVRSVQWNPAGGGLLTASADGTARLWDYYAEACGTYRNHDGSVYEAGFSPDGDRVLTAAADGKARLWNMEGTSFQVFEGHDGSVAYAGISPRKDLLLTTSGDGTARLWRLDGETVAVLRGHSDVVNHGEFSPSGDRVATVSSDGTGRIWDVAGKPVAVLRGHTRGVRGVAWAPAGDRLVTGGDDGTLRAWDADGKDLGVLADLGAQVTAVAWSPAKDRIAAALSDHTARLLDASGKEVAVLKGHTDWLVSVAFSPRGDRVATAALDRTARIWDLEGEETLVLRGHESGLFSVAFSPDGAAVVTGSEDHLARLWCLEPARLLEVADRRANRDLTDEERKRYADLLEAAPAPPR